MNIQRIAILNRGEPARRCLRAIRELREEEGSPLVGIALYTDPDQRSPYVREADEALSLGPALRRAEGGDMRPAYLDHDRVMAALRAVRADAVWPGWGFLAEDPSFVERLESAGVTFLGPRAETMRALGDKIMSKRLAESAEVPVSAWSGGPVEAGELLAAAEKIGFPLMIKATAGGGGRGIRRVGSTDELESNFKSAASEAANAFGDGTLFLERCVESARHVEVQLAADTHGKVLALGVRDCSVQRRHQKLVEEAPPPGLSPELLDDMCESAVRLLERVDYTGVATAEFLVTGNRDFFFLEVNPRLQVEHGVTELTTGFDLVKAQIRIGRGESLPDVVPESRGSAIEVRICAEDPAGGFVPTPGRIALFDLPSGPGIRVDAGTGADETIPSEFDSMIAKILAHGETREEARARLVRAIDELRLVVEDGMTNKGFLLDVLDHPEFRAGTCDTGWLDRLGIASQTDPDIDALIVAAILTYQREREDVRLNFYVEAARGRPRNVPSSTGNELDLVYAGVPYRLTVFAIGGWTYRLHLGDRVVQVRLIEQGPYARQLEVADRRRSVLFSESDVELRIELDGRLHRVQRDVGGRVRAPAPALVIEISALPGDEVSAGDRVGLLEAMKTETAFFAPVSGTVREVLVRPGERVGAGDVLLVIEPSSEDGAHAGGTPLELEAAPDPLDTFRDPDAGGWSLGSGLDDSVAGRGAAVGSLRSEIRRIVTGYDVNPERAETVIRALEADLGEVRESFLAELAQIARLVSVYADIETLFTRTPSRTVDDELGPSNDARMAMYLRRINAEGAGIDVGFLGHLRVALEHYDIRSLEPTEPLRRAVLRLYATRTTHELRGRVLVALLELLVRLADRGVSFQRHAGLPEALDRLVQMRGTVSTAVADLAAQARFTLFERAAHDPSEARAPLAVDLDSGTLPPPDAQALAARAAELGVPFEVARRLELWRLDNFELETIESLPNVYAFAGRARRQPRDERIFCFAEVTDSVPGAPVDPDLAVFEQRFHETIEAMRSIQAARDPGHRMHWNRLYVFVRTPVVLGPTLVDEALRRLAPETGHLGLEKVVVRLLQLDSDRLEAEPRPIEVLAGNPTGSRVEVDVRTPHVQPLAPASDYDRRVASARSRGLVYPYEIVRLFTAPPEPETAGMGAPTGPGHFQEFDLVDGHAVPVGRPPGGNTCGVVFGVITTPTEKHPEGMRRVLVLGDPTYGMGALSAPECDRLVAAIDLAERDEMPVEWVTLSSGARIAVESGTENLDATARVVRRIVTFSDAGGEINLVLPGVNVGAQSYFNALATMGLRSRGVLIMLSNTAYMVLTGRLALEASGGVSAEDEVAIGGYERIMGPTGQAHHQARDLADAYAILLAHYAHAFRAPGEPRPRIFQTRDPRDRDLTEHPYRGEEGFRTLGEIFSADTNAERKRPFAMRELMEGLVDHDAGWLEHWRGWVGAETAIVWDAHLGGHSIELIGIESRAVPRIGSIPTDGPDNWTAGTLFPLSSKKVARAINRSSGNRPVVILANLSGFDGSPESMRRGILEYGAEIARAVVRFEGKLIFNVVSRYHGGAYVVFSRELNDSLRVSAIEGSFASVIGGPAAALVVFPREVRSRANADPRIVEARAAIDEPADPALRAARRARFEQLMAEVRLEKQAEVAAEFDAIHSVERAREVGSIETLVDPRLLRPALIEWLES